MARCSSLYLYVICTDCTIAFQPIISCTSWRYTVLKKKSRCLAHTVQVPLITAGGRNVPFAMVMSFWSTLHQKKPVHITNLALVLMLASYCVSSTQQSDVGVLLDLLLYNNSCRCCFQYQSQTQPRATVIVREPDHITCVMEFQTGYSV